VEDQLPPTAREVARRLREQAREHRPSPPGQGAGPASAARTGPDAGPGPTSADRPGPTPSAPGPEPVSRPGRGAPPSRR
jgi:hypothetical protein